MSPLVGIAFCVSIQFGVLGQTKRWFHEQNLDAFRRNPNKQNLSETDAAKL